MKHSGTVRLETARLLLRRFCVEDAESMYRHWASDDEVTRYLTWPSHQSAADTAGYLAFVETEYDKPTTYNWGIVLKETGELIGNISATVENEAVSSLEMGWSLCRRYWGQGMMPEAAAEVFRFLFDEVEANRLVARHDVDNPKSGRVMQKLGMVFEGVQRQAGKNNRGVVDVAAYALLKEDFDQARG